LAVTAAVPFRVNVQVFCLFPPLEHAPDQMTSRPLVALSEHPSGVCTLKSGSRRFTDLRDLAESAQ